MSRGLRIGLLAILLLGKAAVAADLTQWSRSGSNFTFQLRCESNVEYLIQRSTNLLDWQPVLRSFGGTTNRAIQCVTSNDPSVFFRTLRTNYPFSLSSFALLAKTTVVMGSSVVYVDSFDSTDPRYSTNGLYVPTKHRDKAVVASLSSSNPAVNTGTGKIYGSAAVGPGGTVAGNVGDGAWLAANSGVQVGHVSSNLVATIVDVAAPYTEGLPLPTMVSNQWILTTGDYQSGALIVGGSNSIIISGPGRVRLYFTGDLTTSAGGFIKILPGASLELYLGGKGTLIGTGVVNETLSATNCTIYGLQTCTILTYIGSSKFIGKVYAPQAAFTISGSQEASGSFIAERILVNASAAVHYDEALNR